MANNVNYICRLLIEKIERAPDFSYDDEWNELQRLLALEGRACKWNNDIYNPKIIVYELVR